MHLGDGVAWRLLKAMTHKTDYVINWHRQTKNQFLTGYSEDKHVMSCNKIFFDDAVNVGDVDDEDDVHNDRWVGAEAHPAVM